MRNWISREEETSFPRFNSFQEAWNFFVGKYDKDMVLETVEVVMGKKCYFCALITDWAVYEEMQKTLEEGKPLLGTKYMMCRQPVEIFEDGRVHIVH